MKAEDFYHQQFKTSYAHTHTELSAKIIACMKEYACQVLDHAAEVATTWESKTCQTSGVEKQSILKIKDLL